MALPIIVIGRNRSGTTWLANQLCEHPAIAGVQHERHHGIHESAYFTFIDGRFGDLSRRINYAEFVEVMANSDYFQLAGATRDWLYALWPTDYPGVFRAVMDRMAEERGAAAWVEKSGMAAGVMERIAEAYPDARFVPIVRKLVPNIASTLGSAGTKERVKNRTWAVVRAALGWSFTKREIRALTRAYPDRTHVVAYEDLKSDKEGTLRRVLEFLGLEWDARVLGQTYRPQSSFRSKDERAQALTKGEAVLTRVAAATALLLPRSVLGRLHKRYMHRRRSLPNWFYRLQPFFLDDASQYDDVFGVPGSGEAWRHRVDQAGADAGELNAEAVPTSGGDGP